MDPDFASIPEPRLEVARQLNRGGVLAMPLRTVPVIALHDDVFFENYDYDIIAPRTRQTAALLLGAQGWRARRATRLIHREHEQDLVYPRPNATLGSSPLDPLVAALRRESDVVFATPTQSLLLLLERHGPNFSEDLARECAALVRELPANLPKVHDWCGARGKRVLEAHAGAWNRLQEDSIRARKERRFRSRLPR